MAKSTRKSEEVLRNRPNGKTQRWLPTSKGVSAQVTKVTEALGALRDSLGRVVSQVKSNVVQVAEIAAEDFKTVEVPTVRAVKAIGKLLQPWKKR